MRKITRRELFWGSFLGAISTPLTIFTFGQLGSYRQRENLKHLTPKEAQIYESIAETVIPNENPLEENTETIGLVKTFDELVGIYPPNHRVRLKWLFFMIEHLLPLRGLYFSRFTHLNINERKRILFKLEQSRNVTSRALSRALKGLVVQIYYDNPTVLKKINYEFRC